MSDRGFLSLPKSVLRIILIEDLLTNGIRKLLLHKCEYSLKIQQSLPLDINLPVFCL